MTSRDAIRYGPVQPLGDDLLLSVGAYALFVFDISDPLHPATVGDLGASYVVNGYAPTDVAVDGRQVIVGGDGLWIVDISDPAQPTTVDELWYYGLQMTTADRTLYAVDLSFEDFTYFLRRFDLDAMDQPPVTMPLPHETWSIGRVGTTLVTLALRKH